VEGPTLSSMRENRTRGGRAGGVVGRAGAEMNSVSMAALARVSPV
jgi:hypothetical protein